MNPNIELFRRTAPLKKLEMIDSFTTAELLSVTPATLLKIVKETGTKISCSRDRKLWINHDRQKGNNWNSVIEALSLYKGNLYIECYVQYSNTDTTDVVPLAQFLTRGDFRGTIKHSDRYGNTQHSYYTYDESDKAEVIRSICQEYIQQKYKEKLG